MQNNFITTIKNMQQVLRLWNSHTLTLEERIMIFKTLAISKIVYLALITNVPKVVVKELKTKNKKKIYSKTHVKTLSNTFEIGSLKNVDINLKVKSLQCSWVKKLYDENFHEWKIIPLHLIRIKLGQNFKFHSNLSYDTKLFTSVPVFCKNIFRYWSQHFTVFPDLPSCILSSFLWYHKDILISNKPIYFKRSNNNLSYVTQLFDDTGNTKEWMKLKHEFNLNSNLYFKWMQLIHSIPQKLKNTIRNNRISENLLFLNHHLIKCNILLSLEKLTSKELYLIQLTHDFCKPTLHIYFEKHYNDCVLDLKYIYVLPRIVTSDPYTRYFQYKVLNHVFYLNEKLFFFGISETSQYSFCSQNSEIIEHLFCHGFVAKALWNDLNTFIENHLSLYDLTPHAAFFGFSEKDLDDTILQNHLLLVFKICLYQSRSYGFVCLKPLLLEIKKINGLEKKIPEANANKHKSYLLKWNNIVNQLIAYN